MPTRAVTIMCLVQIVFLVLAWMLSAKFTGLIEKFGQGGIEGVPPALIRFRTYGLLLLTVPLGVAVLCTILTRSYRDIAILGNGGFYLALVSTILMAGFAALVTYVAYHNAFVPGF
jgi:hypothetical protein